MKTILFLLASVLPLCAQSVDYQMLSQDINKLTSQVAESQRPQPQVTSAAISPQTLQFIQQKEVEYNKLIKKYNALLLRSQGFECSDKQAAFDAAVDQTHTKLAVAFPCYSDLSHPIHALADKIYAEHDRENDPMLRQSDSPWIIYCEAARQLGIKSEIK